MQIDPRITDPTKRYDFLFLFDVTDGNPNGDPDAGNLPRVDPETLQGIVTDVCLKRKIRNYVDISGQGGTHYAGIFVRDSRITLSTSVALNTKIKEAAIAVGAKPDKKKVNLDSRVELCKRYYDIRLFGGVLSTGDYNSGQVRGPMQLTFARSIDPILPIDVSITRVAITKEGEQKETEMARKASVPYGLYLGRGFYSPMLATSTGVSKEDLELFWNAVVGMFENDRSAARGYMELKGVYIFRHENGLGNAPSGSLFSRIKVKRKSGVDAPREFDHYALTIEDEGIPDGVELIRLVG